MRSLHRSDSGRGAPRWASFSNQNPPQRLTALSPPRSESVHRAYALWCSAAACEAFQNNSVGEFSRRNEETLNIRHNEGQ